MERSVLVVHHNMRPVQIQVGRFLLDKEIVLTYRTWECNYLEMLRCTRSLPRIAPLDRQEEGRVCRQKSRGFHRRRDLSRQEMRDDIALQY